MRSNNKLTLGKYHYWDEVEDDNIKRFHFMDGSDGTEHHIDFSPYHKPTEEELEAVREIVRITGIIPTRSWNLNNNFHGYTFNHDDPLLQGEPDTVRILNEIKEDYGE
jgi:hypothetical protein|tara:strand:- start:86 stop:409 length:324 start_codon:yes stop_codon:yes gene_type:complete